jgi:hypothetical protein
LRREPHLGRKTPATENTGVNTLALPTKVNERLCPEEEKVVHSSFKYYQIVYLSTIETDLVAEFEAYL